MSGGGKTTNGALLHREYGLQVGHENSRNNQVYDTSSRSEVRPQLLYEFIKRTFDILISLVCLTIGLPVYLIIALAIVINDPGNPFFLQRRVGKNGQVFRIVKFRTMYQNTDKKKSELLDRNMYSGVHFKMENDPRITRVGRFLRKTSLDETPQVLNILFGKMSVVGPRPFVPEEQAQLPNDRLEVKPGLTCYWQISDTLQMSDSEQLELDYRYIRERGISTDCKLIWETVRYVFRAKNC